MSATSHALLAERATHVTRLLKLLASESRLQILCRLSDGEKGVGDLSRATGLSLTATSQHLSRLRAEGLVHTRRHAQTIVYRLEDAATLAIIATLCAIYNPKGTSHDEVVP